MMRDSFALVLILLGACHAGPIQAAETAPLKCGVNEDRVWVYDSLNDFDVAMKLKCGEPVEIVSREKGYVKIRTSAGREGYVEAKALPKPPVAEEKELSAAGAPNGRDEGANAYGSAKSTAIALHAGSTPAKTIPVSAIKTVSAASPAPTGTKVESVAVKSSAGTAAKASNAPVATQSHTAATKGAAAKAKPPADKSATVTAAPAKPAIPAMATQTVLADNISIEPATASASLHPAASLRDPDEEDDAPMDFLKNKENCNVYFSAYGLSPNQYKWMTQSRNKTFSGICPAPAPGLVDFVLIFTHDVDFFNGTMPTTVHTDKNGFSDFTPLSTIDTAVISPSEADKNRREYVWVFHTKRGTFDPARFSPQRHPLYSTTESNRLGTAAGSRSAEDALRFIEQHQAQP